MFRKWSFFRVWVVRERIKRSGLHKAEVEGSDMTFDLMKGAAKLWFSTWPNVQGSTRGEFLNNYSTYSLQ